MHQQIILQINMTPQEFARMVAIELLALQSEPKEDPNEWISYPEVAKITKYSLGTISRKVHARKIEVKRIGRNGAIQRKHIKEIL